jgi:hypothetical protein
LRVEPDAPFFVEARGSGSGARMSGDQGVLLSSLGAADQALVSKHGGSIEYGDASGGHIIVGLSVIHASAGGWTVLDSDGTEVGTRPSVAEALHLADCLNMIGPP